MQIRHDNYSAIRALRTRQCDPELLPPLQLGFYLGAIVALLFLGLVL